LDKLDRLGGDVAKGVEDVWRGSSRFDSQRSSSRSDEDHWSSKEIIKVEGWLLKSETWSSRFIEVRTIVQDLYVQCENFWCASQVLPAMWTYQWSYRLIGCLKRH
jgi:hypothetical protein